MYKTIDSFTGEYRFLSNFYEKEFECQGLKFKSSEHAYQAAKCSDMAECSEIIDSATPGKAKKLGQKCRIKPEWEDIKLNWMYRILIAKFADKELQEKLLATEDFELIEGNNWGDEFWGVCNGKGLNHLGRSLMKVREYYKTK